MRQSFHLLSFNSLMLSLFCKKIVLIRHDMLCYNIGCITVNSNIYCQLKKWGRFMKFISWNVNGLRACMQKGFIDFVNSQNADFICLQETKMQEGQAEVPLDGLNKYFNSAEKKRLFGNGCVYAAYAPERYIQRYGYRGAFARGQDDNSRYGKLLSCECVYA